MYFHEIFTKFFSMQTQIFHKWTRPPPCLLLYYTATYIFMLLLMFTLLLFFIAVFFKHLFFFSILPPIRLWCHYSISCLLHPSTCFNSTSGDSLPLCYMSWPLRFRNFDPLLSSYSRNLARFEPYVCYSSQTLLLLQYTAII